MKLALLGLAVAAGVGLASGRAHASSGEEPAAAAATGGIEVKVEDSFTDVETTRRWVEERAARALEELEPKLAAEDLVRIVVKGGAFEYRISLVLLRRGKPLTAEQQPSEIACACSSDEMLETVATAITAAAHMLHEVAEREATAAAEAQRRREEEEERERQENKLKWQAEHDKAKLRSSTLKHAGVGTFVAGGALTVGGIIMMRQPPQSVNSWQVNDRDWTTPGRVVLGVGITAMAAGLTVMIVDVIRCQRNRSRCEAPATAWTSEHGRWAAQRSGDAR